MPAERAVYVRLSVKDQEAAIAALRQFGDKGESALKRIEQASQPASRGLQAVDAVSRDVTSRLDSMAGSTGAVGSGLRALGPAGLAAAAAIGAVSLGIAEIVKAGEAAERSLFKTEALLKATGNASGLTARQIDAMAVSIGEATLISTKEARDATAALLTFRSVSGDTFGEVLKLSADLAAVGFGSISSAAQTLGRAIEDPERGMTALRRAGIVLSPTVVENIKNLNDLGKTSEATAILLEELRKRVGGAAEGEAKGLAGAFDDLGDALDRFLELAADRSGILADLTGFIRGVAAAAQGMNAALFPTDQRRLGQIASRVFDAQSELDALDGGLGSQRFKERRRAELEAEINGLLKEREEILARIAAEQKEIDDAREKGNAAQAEMAAERRLAAEKEANDKAEKQRQTERAAVLREMASLEHEVALAGISGIDLLIAKRDEEFRVFGEYAEKKLITEEEYSKARLLIEEKFEKEVRELRAREQERENEKIRRAEEKAYEERRRAAERATDDVVRYTADRMADLFSDTKGGWKRMWENMKQTAISMAARIAAEATIRPIVSPIVGSIFGTGAGGASGGGANPLSFLGLGGGGGTGASPGGGLGSFANFMPNPSSFFGNNGGPSLFSKIGQSIGGLFGTGAGAGGPAGFGYTGLLADAAIDGTYLGGSTSAVGLSGAANGIMGAIPVWGWIALAATIAKQFVAGADRRSPAGVLDTLLLPSLEQWMADPFRANANVIDPIGTVLGDLSGNRTIAGILNPLTLLGGIGKKGFSGGQVNLAADENGNLIRTQSGFKRYDGAAAEAEADKAIAAINQVFDALDINLTKHDGNFSRITFGAEGQSMEETIQQILKLGGVSSGFADLDEKIRSMDMSGTVEEVMQRLTDLVGIFRLLNDVAEEGTLDPEPLTQAEQVLKAINEKFDDLSKKGAQFGFSLEQLEQARDKAIASLAEGFDHSIELQILAFTNPMKQAMENLADVQEQRLREAKAAGADLVQVEKLAALERKHALEQVNQPLQDLFDAMTVGQGVLSPTAQIAGAESRFDTIRAAVLGGDYSQRDDLALAAQQLDEISRTAFASGPQYFERRDFIMATLRNLLGDTGSSGGGYADGTASAAAGWHWVGERGPELMRFRGGEQVLPNGVRPSNTNDPLARELRLMGRETVRAGLATAGEVAALRRDMARIGEALERQQSYLARLAARG